ncbi:MAG: cysteine--tRNA ligase [Ruminococcaceae bacterium]|nr:cysteine--tRNA ligase [Oscillospiraceae bacterium]
MRLFNSLTGKKEEFTVNDNKVRMYACGPTVYNYFHVGNARCFVLFDMLRRYFEYRGYEVTFVQNFTDIDDKMIKRAAEENTTVSAVADKYIKEYFIDAKGLGVKPASFHPRATENIDEIINIIQTLIDKGHAYVSNGDVYFSARSFCGYGKLSKTDIDDLESGARIDVSEIKKDPLDFALWKAYKEGEPFWEAPWGKGRPGWHIECSAMVNKYLGKTIDIHCGGADLSFPHHENEIAQSEACFGCEFSRFWLHNGYINVNNQKMSKSLGNFFTVRDAAAEYGYDAIRFFLLSAHYKSPVNYSADTLEQSKSALQRLYNCEDNLKQLSGNLSDVSAYLDEDEEVKVSKALAYKEKFIEVMDDDFNTADGISVIFELVRDINAVISGKCSGKAVNELYSLYNELVTLMGLKKPEKESSGALDDDAIKALIDERAAAKKEKNYKRADEIREYLKSNGIILEDTKNGTTYKYE